LSFIVIESNNILLLLLLLLLLVNGASEEWKKHVLDEKWTKGTFIMLTYRFA